MAGVYFYLVIYIALLLLISYLVSRRQNKEDFFIGGRNRGGWQIFASKFAGAIGAGWFITYTGFAYEYGLGVFTLLIGMVVGFTIFAYWAAPKVQKDSKKHKFYTIGDFVYHKTKSMISKHIANILSSVILFSWLIVGVIGGAKIINDFGFLSYNTALLITVLVILSYILLAGFKAVILTDIFQSIVIFTLLLLITFSITGSKSLGSLLTVQTGTMDIGVAFGFFLYGLLSVFAFSDRYQLAYAAKNKRKLIHGLGLSVIPILLAACLLLLIGLFMASEVAGLDTGLVFTEAMKNFLPAAILPLAVVLFFAGIMSSADTSVYAIASHYALSLKKHSVPLVRKAIIALMAVTLLIGFFYSDIIDITVLAASICMILSFPMIYLFFNGKNKSRFLGSVVGGIIGLVGGLFFLGLEPTLIVPVVVANALGLLWNL